MNVAAYAAKSAKSALECWDYEPGPLAAHEVEIKVSHCGICLSDIAMIDNDWGRSSYPIVPGHEVVGTITAVGANVDDQRRIGQRVGVGWFAGSCGACEKLHARQATSL